MVSVRLAEGISETLDILNHMNKVYMEKIPLKFIEFLEKNKSKTYIPNIDHSKKLNELNLKKKTRDILFIIYTKYWCGPEEKKIYYSALKENQIRKEREARIKYNPENIFKK